LSAYCQGHVGAYGNIMSCLALNGAASQGPGSSGAYLVLKIPSGVAAKGQGACQARL
jgi:hypothetical protein